MWQKQRQSGSLINVEVILLSEVFSIFLLFHNQNGIIIFSSFYFDLYCGLSIDRTCFFIHWSVTIFLVSKSQRTAFMSIYTQPWLYLVFKLIHMQNFIFIFAIPAMCPFEQRSAVHHSNTNTASQSKLHLWVIFYVKNHPTSSVNIAILERHSVSSVLLIWPYWKSVALV